MESSSISPGVWFGSTRVTIGRNTFVNRGVLFNTAAPIVLGSNVDVGMNVVFITGSHAIGTSVRRAGEHEARPIEVGDGAWIGAGVVLLPGVTIGRGAIVAAGAVVTDDCDADSLYAGVPARIVKALPRASDPDYST